jgi:hypothetical protein
LSRAATLTKHLNQLALGLFQGMDNMDRQGFRRLLCLADQSLS